MDSLSCALFPSSCALCKNPLISLSRVPICESCWSRLSPQSGHLCSRCGEDLGVSGFSTPLYNDDDPRSRSGEECEGCRTAPPAFAKAVAYGAYQAELRGLIHLLKYRGMRPIAGELGRRMAASFESSAGSDSQVPRSLLVVPVPMHRARRRERGFNQAELLGRAMANELHRLNSAWRLKFDAHAIDRTKATVSQTGLTLNQRKLNLAGAFIIRKKEAVKAADVLLVDDVYTSGATARACSRALLRGGAASVRVVTAAHTQREGVAFWDDDTRSFGAGSRSQAGKVE